MVCQGSVYVEGIMQEKPSEEYSREWGCVFPLETGSEILKHMEPESSLVLLPFYILLCVVEPGTHLVIYDKSQGVWVQILVLLSNDCVILGKLQPFWTCVTYYLWKLI